MTARWVVEKVAPERDLRVAWEPISLLFKNEVEEGSRAYSRYKRTHDLLRVMESVRAADGNEGVFGTYWEFGKRIHHDRELKTFSIEEALAEAGVSTDHAAAYHEAAWDAEIRRRMEFGLALAGDDVGTPIIAFDDANGARVGMFGPVISRVPETDLALQLWDGLQKVMTVPGFWELKRTRTEEPDFGARP